MSIKWGGNIGATKAWSVSGSGGIGIDLRVEMSKILYGDGKEKAQGHTIMLRKMDQVCPCIQEERGQKYRKPDPKCSICHGEGYTYSDVPVTAWRSEIGGNSNAVLSNLEEATPGTVAINGFNYYFDYRLFGNIKSIDKIIEVSLGVDGSVPQNTGEVNYKEKFKIVQLIIYRADNGRVEFVKAACEKEDW